MIRTADKKIKAANAVGRLAAFLLRARNK